MMVRPIELLVHISAPSGARDDARYRRQAQALLDFEVFKRHDAVTDEGDSSVGPSRPVRRSSSNARAIQREPPSILHSKEGDQVVGNKSAGVSFDSASDATGSQDADSTANATVQGTDGVWAGNFQDEPERLSVIHVHRTPGTVRPTSAPTGTAAKPLVQHQNRRSLSDSWETPPSVIPDSQPWTSGLKRPLFGSSSSPYEVEPSPLAKRLRLLAPSQLTLPSSSQDAEQSIEDPPWSPKLTLTEPPSPSPPPSVFPEDSDLPIQRIIPSPPPTSLQPFTTAAIPSLLAVVQKLPLSRFFLPLHTSRPPCADERGFWRICIPKHWDVFLRKKFWDFLIQFIGKGESSWLWCERYLLHTNEEDESTAEESLEKSGGGSEEVVRVYCWGEVVAHTYLLLFLGVGKRIKGMKPAWYGSSGELVIQME